jgi:glycosyltransferase involved in cell wall biosynthesis
MLTPRLSLVVPVYNVAPWLTPFLESLAAQTLPAAEFEVVAVDDGSTDDSPAILQRFAARMANLRIVRRENGGLSAARNTGIEHARGEWLAFADSDDLVAPGAYARWLAAAEADRLDMLLGNGVYHHEGRAPDRPIFSGVAPTAVMAGTDWLRARLEARFLPHMVCLHLYRREFIERHGFRFVPRLIHEDVIWTTRALLRAARVRFDAEPCYLYRVQTARHTPEQRARHLERVIDSSVYNARQLSAIVATEVDDAALARLIGWQLTDGALSVLHHIEQLPEAAARRVRYRSLRSEAFFSLLWRHALDARQKRKVASRWLRATLRSLTS